MLTEAYLEPSRAFMMELFSVWLSHILKTYLIRSNFPFFTQLKKKKKRLTILKTLGEKVFC